ncbi:hypothetical protein JCM17823_02900 [Halorubrum gandharaense]
MVTRLVERLRGSSEPDLASVRTAETLRDVADADALAARLPAEWSVRPDVVVYGEDVLTDALVFRHDRSRQELALVPESNLDPQGPATFYHHDRNGGLRKELGVEIDTLVEALEYALDRIDRFERLYGTGGPGYGAVGRLEVGDGDGEGDDGESDKLDVVEAEADHMLDGVLSVNVE